MTYLNDAVLRAGIWLTQGTTPSPSPTFGSYTGDEDLSLIHISEPTRRS